MNKFTYSEVFYYFADKVIKPAGLIALKDEHISGSKLSAVELGQKMVFAAVAYLLDNGFISLSEKEVSKLLLFKERAVFVTKIKEPSDDVSGIEKSILNSIKGEIKLYDVVRGLLTSDLRDPWGQIVLFSKDSLVEKGVLKKEATKKLIFTFYKYSKTAGSDETMQGAEDSMRSGVDRLVNNPQLYQTVWKAIVAGIRSREEHSEVDAD